MLNECLKDDVSVSVLLLGGGFKYICFTFTPRIGEDAPILTNIFAFVETTQLTRTAPYGPIFDDF